MKKNSLSLMAFLSACFLWSCGNNSGSSTTSDTTSTSTTTTMDTSSAMNSNPPATTTSTTPLEQKDKDFVMKAAAGGMMEVELGNVAQQNAVSQRVKDFGSMMVRDHSKANDELKSLASSKGLMLNADSLMQKHKAEIDKLRSKTGKDFDKAYMNMMVEDHQKDVKEFENASKNAMDADLKSWTGKTVPTLQMHLDSAQAIHKSVK